MRSQQNNKNMSMITSRSFPLRMRNVSDRSYRGNRNSYFRFNNIFRQSRRLCDNAEKC